MSVDEHAHFQWYVNGLSVIRVGGVWWLWVRPFFYRPLDLFVDYPETQKVPWDGLALGAVQYPVAPGVPASSSIRLIICQEVAKYSFAGLRGGMRSDIRRGWREFEVHPIPSVEALISGGHPVYCDFYRRTGYGFKSSCLEPMRFAEWARAVFARPKVRVLGAYHNGELAAVSISYRVLDTLHYSTYFGNDFAHAGGAAECMLHTIRKDASQEPGLRYLFAGSAGMPRGLDRFYLRRGFEVLERPSQLRGNPLVLGSLRSLAPEWYRRISGSLGPDSPPRAEGSEPTEEMSRPVGLPEGQGAGPHGAARE